MVMEHFDGILFHKSGLANKQHTNQPTNCYSSVFTRYNTCYLQLVIRYAVLVRSGGGGIFSQSIGWMPTFNANNFVNID